MCVASSEWIKLGGNADACLIEFTVDGAFGSEMNTVWSEVITCFRFTARYGCTIGSPSGVVHTTDVICSFFHRGVLLFDGVRLPDAGAGEDSSNECTSRSSGIAFAMRRAQVFSQVWMSFAPWNKSPIEASTFFARYDAPSQHISGGMSPRSLSCRSIWSRAPINVTPYTVVMT